MGADHPVVLVQGLQGRPLLLHRGGNTAGSFGEAAFRSHLDGAIDWTAGVADPVYSDCGATVLANYQQTKISAPPNLIEPIGFDQFPDGRIIQTDRRGGGASARPGTGTTTVSPIVDPSMPLTRGSTRTERTACTARRSTTTSPRTTGSTSTTRRRRGGQNVL